MSCCSIRWCGKNSKTSNYKTDGITFHRFPKNPFLKERWINCAKRENWCPSNYSVVCSRHFTEDCFYTSKSRRHLYDTAIPTLNLPVTINIISVASACLIPSSSSQNASISTTPMASKRKATDPATLSKFNTMTNKRLHRRVLQLTSEVKRKNKTIKLLQDKVRYYVKRMALLKIKQPEKKNIIKIRIEKKKNMIKTEAADI